MSLLRDLVIKIVESVVFVSVLLTLSGIVGAIITVGSELILGAPNGQIINSHPFGLFK